MTAAHMGCVCEECMPHNDPNTIEQAVSEVQVGTFAGLPVTALTAIVNEADEILHQTEALWARPSAPTPPPGASVLLLADSLIHGERAATHGPVKETFEKIALIAKGMGVEISPTGVCKVLIALKLARECYNPGHRDNLIDAAGYIGLLDELKS